MVKVVSVKVSDRLYGEFKALCERNMQTISDVLYELIDVWVESMTDTFKAEDQKAKKHQTDEDFLK